jgi:hypothetical protein
MKKAIIAIISAMFLISCGQPNEAKPIEATYGPVGIDSSNILPALTDSAKGGSLDSPVKIETLNAK